MRSFDVMATDLDGTFLTAARTVPALNAHAVRVAHERGVAVVFATGRPPRWLTVLAELADVPTWAVAANGAVTMDMGTNTIVRAQTIPAELVLEVCTDVRRELPSARFVVEYADAWGAEADVVVHPHWMPPCRTGEIESLLDRDDIIKVLIQDPAHPTRELYAGANPVVADRMTVTYSHDAPTGLLELSAVGVSKARALTQLLTDLGTTPERMIAFGDMLNDLEMLRLAGRGFAMAEADHTLVDAGIPQIGSNEDGAVGAKVLELLGEEAPEADR